jgi:hypothetical protein
MIANSSALHGWRPGLCGLQRLDFGLQVFARPVHFVGMLALFVRQH